LFEKYRPKSFDEIVGQEAIIDRIVELTKRIKRTGKIVHFLFYGPPGTGKTSTAQCIARELFGKEWRENYREFNASDARGIDDVRQTYKRLAAIKGLKVLFLDEADNMTADAQQAMRRIMETTRSTIFILSANRPWKIIEPIRSRCVPFQFRKISDRDVAKYLLRVLKLEGVKWKVSEESKRLILDIVKAADGDLRKALNLLESVIDEQNNLVLTRIRMDEEDSCAESALVSALNGDFDRARELIEDSLINNGSNPEVVVEKLYRALGRLDKQKYDVDVVIRLYDKLAETDRAIKVGGNPVVQLVGFVAYAYVAPHLIKCPALSE